MDDKLPRGWVRTTLGEVCVLNPRTRFDEDLPEDIQVSFVPMAAVEEDSGRLDPSETRRLQTIRSGYTRFEENDIIFSKITPCMENGKIALAKGLKNGLALGSTEFYVLRPEPGVLPRFVLHYLLQKSIRLEAERHMSGAVGQKRVPAAHLLGLDFLLPPTQEQERIIAKLDEALFRLEAAEGATRRAQKRLSRYRDATLEAAVTGQFSQTQGNVPAGETGESLLLKLIDERRDRMQVRSRKVAHTKAPTLPRLDGHSLLPPDWTWASLDQLSWASSYGTSAKCTRDAKGPAVLRIPNIQNRNIQTTDLKFADSRENFDADDFVAPGDFLLIRTNGSKDLIGRAAVVQSPPEPQCSFASYLIRFRLVGDATIWEWISTAWDSECIRRALESRAVTTAGQYNLSLSRLADLPIPIPPKREMTVIIREVAQRFHAADRLATSLNSQLAKASITRESLLREAVEGRLVPQDPQDEPAPLLLERIRTTRQSQPKRLRTKRMTKARRKAIRRPLIDVLREFARPVTPEELFKAAGFDESQVDVFYHELAALRGELREVKPTGTNAKLWPENASVLLQLSALDLT